MQSELPWNVAGIPAEARDAARAAARREGLSVGEWMTRRIMRGFPEAAAEERSTWRPTFVEPPPVAQEFPPSPRDSEEMLARVARSENEAQNAYRTLDQQLKTVARRLETAEHNQTENNRAMTQAATQINIAAREQAQAFEQMSANVGALADRVTKIERQALNDGVRDAVKALHEGLSRVADQIAQTANDSASQIAALAGNVDSLATQLVETRQSVDATAQGAEARLGAFDERLRVVERTAFSGASALDHTMENVEALRATKDSMEAEMRQQAATVAHIRDSFEQFSAHGSINESTRAAAMARLEERLSELQAQHSESPLDRRLDGIEHVLSDIMTRLEKAEHTSASTSGNAEQTLRELALGFETADRHNRDTIRDLQTAMQETAAKITAVEQKLTAAAQSHPAEPILDTPHFAEQPPHMTEAAPDYASQTDLADAFAPFPNSADSFSAVPPFVEPAAPVNFGEFTDEASKPPFANESFLAAARRSANEASAKAAAEAPERSGFAWNLKGKSEEAGSSSKRYLMAGSVFGVIVAAALGGVVLTRGVGSTQSQSLPVAAISTPIAAKPSPSPQPRDLSQTGSPSNEAAGGVPQSTGASMPAPAAASTEPAPPRIGAAPSKHATETAETSRLPVAAAGETPSVAPAKAASIAASPVQRLASLAKTGDAKGQLLLGLRYLEGNGVAVNEAEAARWLGRAAQQGEPMAQYRLGTLYERGRGVAADPKQASHWYELAAKQGNRKAMHNLAVSFAEGTGEPKDPAQAAMWFSRAANLGLADSQFNLAVLYERGMGVKQSLTDAYKWYVIAAAQGDAESKTRAEALATQLSDADRAAAQQAVAGFKPQPLDPAANSIPALG